MKYNFLDGKYGLELESVYTVKTHESQSFESLPKTSLIQYKYDGSIKVNNDEYSDDCDSEERPSGTRSGVEVVTRPRKFSKCSMNRLEKFLQVYRTEYAGRVNNSTGLHLHLGHKDCDILVFARMHNIIFTMQSALSDIVPSSRLNNQYCQYISLGNYNANMSAYTMKNEIKSKYYIVSWRYNRAIGPCASGNHVEVRMHSGTLNINKIKNWVILWSHILEFAYQIAQDEATYYAYFDTLLSTATSEDRKASIRDLIISTNSSFYTENLNNIKAYMNRSSKGSKPYGDLMLTLEQLLNIIGVDSEVKQFYYNRREQLLQLRNSGTTTDTDRTPEEIQAIDTIVNKIRDIAQHPDNVQLPSDVQKRIKEAAEREVQLENMRNDNKIVFTRVLSSIKEEHYITEERKYSIESVGWYEAHIDSCLNEYRHTGSLKEIQKKINQLLIRILDNHTYYPKSTWNNTASYLEITCNGILSKERQAALVSAVEEGYMASQVVKEEKYPAPRMRNGLRGIANY